MEENEKKLSILFSYTYILMDIVTGIAALSISGGLLAMTKKQLDQIFGDK